MPALLVVAIVVFLEIVCLGAIFPTLADYVTQLGGAEIWVGIAFALVAAPKVVMNPAWGRLSDRIGRKPVVVLLTLGAIGGSTLWALAPMLGNLVGSGLMWLAVSRLIYGIFSAQAAIAYSIASDTSPPEKRSAAMGVLGAAFGVGLTVGFPLGGIVGAHSLAAVGWLCAGCETLALLVVLVLLRETRPAGPVAAAPRWAVLRYPAVRGLLGVTLIATVGYSVMTVTLRLLTDDWYGFTIQQTGYAFALWGIVGIIVQGGLIRPIVKALGERHTIILGAIILAAAMAGLAIHPPVAGFWAATAMMALGGGLLVPTLTGLLSHQVQPHEQGALHGINQSITAMGRAISYVTGGALYVVAPGMPYGLGAALLLVSVGLLLAWSARRSPHAAPPEGRA